MGTLAPPIESGSPSASFIDKNNICIEELYVMCVNRSSDPDGEEWAGEWACGADRGGDGKQEED